MPRSRRLLRPLCAGGPLLLSLIVAGCLDDGYEPANSLRWPLRSAATGNDRAALGSSFGEYQSYGGPPFLHTGIDIRGLEGDPAIIVADGNIWLTANFQTDSCQTATNCRLYIKGSDGRYIYYYSHLRLYQEAEEMTSEVRARILNATRQGSGYAVNPGTDVTAGQVLSGIADFSNNAWAHLHFGIIDASENYDVINPLTALSGSTATPPILDDERPTIAALELQREGTATVVTPTGGCGEVSGALDIAATMKDSFFTTNPAPEPVPGVIDSIGVYEAKYRIRRLATNTVTTGTWYRLDRAPILCAGANRGLSCATHLSEADFFAHSIDSADGALGMGEPYAAVLFSDPRSSTIYDVPGGETYVHLLTNQWGINGSWDSAAGPDGLYQVSVEVSDQAGNQRASSMFVLVNNTGAPVDPAATQRDAYVRDNGSDIGAIPSTLGGEPFWVSPDIMVFPQGSPVDVHSGAGSSQVDAGVTYDVYVRVANDRCSSVTGIKASVFSANPAMILDESAFVHITSDFTGDAAHPDGLTLGPRERGLLGPFTWTPSAAEAASNNGHRCLKALINSADDPVGSDPIAVADDNNIAQRNMQVEDSSFDLGNPGPRPAMMEIEFRCNDFPVSARGAIAELSVGFSPALAEAWSAAPHATVRRDQSRLTVRFGACNVPLPAVRVPPMLRLPAAMTLKLPPEAEGRFRVDLLERLDRALRGGMSFTVERRPSAR
jgi:hypothetical protein